MRGASTRSDLVAAAERLRGHLVSCPVIGDLFLPGFELPPELRIKAELLQPGGSLWFRGAQHWLMRQMGRWKGIACTGSRAEVLAWARAAHGQRTAMVARVQDPTDSMRATFAALGCRIEASDLQAAAPTWQGQAGYLTAPGRDDADVELGIATVVLELASELPSGTERLVVAPAELTPAVARGVRLLGLAWQVQPSPRQHPLAEAVAMGLRDHHRLCADPEGAAALAYAVDRAGSGTCVVLGV